MSKILAPIPTVLAAFVLILQFFTFAEGQDIDVLIKIKAEKAIAADVTVSVNVTNKAETLWFMDQYGDVSRLLTERFSHIYFYDKPGFLIARKRIQPNEMVNLRNVGKLIYTVDLTPRPGTFAAAHTSWAKDDGGMLVLDDLLPQAVGKTAKVSFELPVGWKVASLAVQPVAVPNIEKAVFYVGSNMRELATGPIRLAISGEWQFTDAEAAEMAVSIAKEYEKIFGKLAESNVIVRLSKFPNQVGFGNWEGDTRSSTVTIVSSDMPFKNQSVQRLHEQLRHEMFHLWIPNGVNLSGNYDWFYEGFALYQSLKVGVGVNRLRFEDFLDTLSRAYAIEESQTKRISLIDASANRWSGSNTTVYARGMLLGFLCDIAMLEASGGKRSVTDLIKEVISKHSLSMPRTDGNTALVAIFKSHAELAAMAERYISGSEPFAIEAALSSAGIEIDRSTGVLKFKVVNKPPGKQRKILEKLGIDNWKKN
ncbi:MAG: hypothetical protein ABL999_14795 [Pyrinomonadaceae bacterium]